MFKLTPLDHSILVPTAVSFRTFLKELCGNTRFDFADVVNIMKSEFEEHVAYGILNANGDDYAVRLHDIPKSIPYLTS